MNLKSLSHMKLIKLCVRAYENESVWLEFHNRFDNHIRLFVNREFKQNITSKWSQQFVPICEDLVQDVYFKLIEKNFKALKNFKGSSDNAIFMYLTVIARNVVRNYKTRMAAQKRPAVERSLDDMITITEQEDRISYKDRLRSDQLDIENMIILNEEIKICLDKVVRGKNRDRDMLIFKLFMDGFLPEEIAEQFNFDLSAKRVSNIISYIKQGLRKIFKEKK